MVFVTVVLVYYVPGPVEDPAQEAGEKETIRQGLARQRQPQGRSDVCVGVPEEDHGGTGAHYPLLLE